MPKEVVQYYSSPKNSPHMWKSLCIEGTDNGKDGRVNKSFIVETTIKTARVHKMRLLLVLLSFFDCP